MPPADLSISSALLCTLYDLLCLWSADIRRGEHEGVGSEIRAMRLNARWGVLGSLLIDETSVNDVSDMRSCLLFLRRWGDGSECVVYCVPYGVVTKGNGFS